MIAEATVHLSCRCGAVCTDLLYVRDRWGRPSRVTRKLVALFRWCHEGPTCDVSESLLREEQHG